MKWYETYKQWLENHKRQTAFELEKLPAWVVPPEVCPICSGDTFVSLRGYWVCECCLPQEHEHLELKFDLDHKEVLKAQAIEVLNKTGVRLIELSGQLKVGIWSDLDSPEVREALRTLGLAALSVVYLDDPEVPLEYHIRTVPGESVPLDVLEKMKQSTKPWEVRDRLLAEMGWRKAAPK